MESSGVPDVLLNKPVRHCLSQGSLCVLFFFFFFLSSSCPSLVCWSLLRDPSDPVIQ